MAEQYRDDMAQPGSPNTAHDTPESADIVDLGGQVHCIDTRMGGYHGIAAGYAILGSRPALIETGTALSAPIVQKALGQLGIGPSDLATVVVTHIHLDHAGGVGDIARMFPNATVVVHERGARHLADPSRLVASARRVFGDALDTLFGELRPVDAERIVSLGDVGVVDLGDGRCLEAFYAPGHASHHVGLVDSLTGDLYTGDAAGVYVPETAQVRPATPPPDFDLDQAITSIHTMMQIAPTRLLFSHFGPVSNVQSTLEQSVEELRLWVDIVARARGTQDSPEHDLDHAVAMIRQRFIDGSAGYYGSSAVQDKFETLSPVRSNVTGISRWLDRPADSSGAAAVSRPRG